MEDQNHPGETVSDPTFLRLFHWMYTGRYSDQKDDEMDFLIMAGKNRPESSKKYEYQIKEMHTQNLLGQYPTGRWEQGVISYGIRCRSTGDAADVSFGE